MTQGDIDYSEHPAGMHYKEGIATGYTYAQLLEAFEQVCNKEDWKAEINCTVSIDRLAITLLAIQWFTGTWARAQLTDYKSGLYRVTAEGYRKGPAGP